MFMGFYKKNGEFQRIHGRKNWNMNVPKDGMKKR